MYWLQTSRRFTRCSIVHSASRGAYLAHSCAIQSSRLFFANSGYSLFRTIDLFPAADEIFVSQCLELFSCDLLVGCNADFALQRRLPIRAEISEINYIW